MGGNIKPFTLNRFWHRRICEATFLVAVAVIGLYTWIFITKTTEFGQSLSVNFPTIILAGATALFCFISYLWPPKTRFMPPSLIIYLLLTATISMLIISTGGISSPFIALLMLVIIFADVFGLWGAIPIILAASAFTIYQYINNRLTLEVIIIISFSALLPLLASLVIWHRKPRDIKPAGDDNKSYRNLATELSEVASKSEVVINAIGDGVIALDNNGIVQLINPAAQILTGWSKSDAITLNYTTIIHLINMEGEPIEGANDPISQSINTNTEIRTSNLTMVTKSGKKIMVAIVASPVSATASGVIVVFRDITKEKAEEREQAEFISTASHEMRTPVAAIEGYLGLALNPQTAQIDDRARDFIMKAHYSAKHLGHLFQDLLDISKADDGRMPNNPTVTNMVDLVREIIQGLGQSASEKGLRIVFLPDSNKPGERSISPNFTVNLDGDHIREIINNLVENAIKYTNTGSININITGDEDDVVISIADTGVGIPAEDIPHLFQKFYRVSSKDTNDIGGTGLGLYLSRRLVELLGGRIWAESKHGVGSTFYVQLPRINSQDIASVSEQKQPAPAMSVEQPTQNPVPTTDQQPVKPATTVPRGEALTPEQIAEYVAKQRALAQQENNQS